MLSKTSRSCTCQYCVMHTKTLRVKTVAREALQKVCKHACILKMKYVLEISIKWIFLADRKKILNNSEYISIISLILQVTCYGLSATENMQIGDKIPNANRDNTIQKPTKKT